MVTKVDLSMLSDVGNLSGGIVPNQSTLLQTLSILEVAVEGKASGDLSNTAAQTALAGRATSTLNNVFGIQSLAQETISGSPQLLHVKDFRFTQTNVNHDDVSGISIFRNANYTGGNGGSPANGGFGWTNTALRIYSYVGENARSNEWGHSVVVFNKAPGTGSPIAENCAHYAVGHKQVRSDGQPTTFTFGAVSEVVDHTFSPTKGSVAHEFDVTVVGPNNTDVNNTRVGTYLAIRSDPGSEGGNEASLGHATVIFSGIHLKTLFNLQLSGGTVGTYFNFPQFNVTSTGVVTNKSTVLTRSSLEAADSSKLAMNIDGVEYGRLYLDTAGNLNIFANANAKVRLNAAAGSIEPSSNNVTNSGSSTNRWKDTYQSNAAIVSSDGRLKTDLTYFTDLELDAIGEVQVGMYQLLASREEKGDEARFHTGVIAQQIEEVFSAKGLAVEKHGFWCSNPWIDIVEEEIEVEEPATETFTNYRDAYVVVDGKAFLTKEPFEDTKHIYDEYPVFDENQSPVMVPAIEAKYDKRIKEGRTGDHEDDYETILIRAAIPKHQKTHPVKRMVKVAKKIQVQKQRIDPITKEPMNKLSIRYEQLLMALFCWTKRELEQIKEKL